MGCLASPLTDYMEVPAPVAVARFNGLSAFFGRTLWRGTEVWRLQSWGKAKNTGVRPPITTNL